MEYCVLINKNEYYKLYILYYFVYSWFGATYKFLLPVNRQAVLHLFLKRAAAVYTPLRPHCSAGTSTWWMNTFIRVNTDEEECEATLPHNSCHLDCPFQPPPLSPCQVSTTTAVPCRLSPTEVIMPVITLIKDKDARSRVQKAHCEVADSRVRANALGRKEEEEKKKKSTSKNCQTPSDTHTRALLQRWWLVICRLYGGETTPPPSSVKRQQLYYCRRM